MDLLTTVRKEGSRGGTGDFKWSDVQSSTRRENYLGHSLMAPVGRWQKGKVLDWYAKGDTENREGETDTERATRERKEEIRLVKEAEQDALARALGFEVAPRNPNLEALGDKRELDRVLKEAVDGEDGTGGKGVGFGILGPGGPKPQSGDDERIEGNAEGQDAELGKALREYKRRHRDDMEAPRTKRRETDTESTVEDQGRESIIETGETGLDRGQQVEKRDLGERVQFKGLDEPVMSAIAVDHLAGGNTTEMIDIDGMILTDEGNQLMHDEMKDFMIPHQPTEGFCTDAFEETLIEGLIRGYTHE